MVRPFGRSSAGLAMNFAGETAAVISLSYFFHKTGHHKMERAVSIVNIASSTGSGELRTHAPLSDIYSFRASPHPLRCNGIIHLGENRPIISGAQSLAGKILNPKYLPRR